MDALAQIRAKINDYPGYGTEDDVRASDQMVRAFTGERLARLQDRLGAQAEALDPLIARAEFANQRALVPFENPRDTLADTQPLEIADAALLEAAEAAESVTPETLAEYAANVTQLFDRRDESLMRASIALRRS